MDEKTKRLLVYYGVFCAVNIAVGYYYSRNAKIGDPIARANSFLLRFNVLVATGLVPQ